MGLCIGWKDETAGREPPEKDAISGASGATPRSTSVTCGDPPRQPFAWHTALAQTHHADALLTDVVGIRERILASGCDLRLSRPITAEEIERAREGLRRTA
jgi:hypothetical protein